MDFQRLLMGAVFGFFMSVTAFAAVEPVRESFATPWNHEWNLDSLALWSGHQGENWLLATSKSQHEVLVFDAFTGEYLTQFGKLGKAAGDFKRPNGIAVLDDLVFVVERDNHRVQVLSLPDFKPLAILGSEDLVRPYGITLVKIGSNKIKVFVTDDNRNSPGTMLRRYVVDSSNMSVKSSIAFGDTQGPGTLFKVESIMADPDNRILMVADEGTRDIKIYDFDGHFTGTVMGKGLFKADPEGIALYPCRDGGGFWIMTDQNLTVDENIFHIFDRKTLKLVGSFRGLKTTNTDGVTLTTHSSKFPNGAMYALDNDGGVTAFSLEGILKCAE